MMNGCLIYVWRWRDMCSFSFTGLENKLTEFGFMDWVGNNLYPLGYNLTEIGGEETGVQQLINHVHHPKSRLLNWPATHKPIAISSQFPKKYENNSWMPEAFWQENFAVMVSTR